MSSWVRVLNIPLINPFSVPLRSYIEEGPWFIHLLALVVHDLKSGFNAVVHFDPLQPRITVDLPALSEVRPGSTMSVATSATEQGGLLPNEEVITWPFLVAITEGQELDDPPEPTQLQLVVLWAQRVIVVFVLLRHERLPVRT